MNATNRLLMRRPATSRDAEGRVLVSLTELECGHPRKYGAQDLVAAYQRRGTPEFCERCAEIAHPVTNPQAWAEARKQRSRNRGSR